MCRVNCEMLALATRYGIHQLQCSEALLKSAAWHCSEQTVQL